MDDQFDDNLKNRILEVFENFEAPSANEGWLLLREKFPEKKERRPAAWLWWGAAAAILLMFFGIAIFTNYNQDQTKKLTYKNQKAHPQQDIAVNKKKLPAEEQTINRNNAPVIIKKNSVAENPSTLAVKKSYAPSANRSIIVRDSSEGEHILAGNKKMQEKTVDSSVVRPNQNLAKQDITGNTAGNIAANQGNIIGGVITKKPGKQPISIFDDDNKDGQNTANNTSSIDNAKKVSFSIYAATYVNYAKGSNSQLNAGVGFTSDIHISKNLKFSTGVILAQNTLNYNTAPLKEPRGNDLSYISTSTEHAYAAVSSKGLTPNTGLSSANPVFKNYNASLMGLDIPLNIKYEFDPQKSATYISAGLSSGTFVNEVYTYSYLNPLSQQTQDASTHNNFSNFYFAKTLNVSFGVGYPLGKSNLLIIEPFIKYPIDGLGAQQIKFGAGGINFKFNFKSSTNKTTY